MRVRVRVAVWRCVEGDWASLLLPGFDMAQSTELIEKAVQISLRNNANALRGP